MSTVQHSRLTSALIILLNGRCVNRLIIKVETLFPKSIAAVL